MTLQHHNYILLGTLRKNGNFVDKPVWFAGDDESLYVFSAGDAGKVKRLRNFSEARVAPCSMTGKPLGEAVPAAAELIGDAAGIEYAHRLLVKKYGWQMRLLDFFAGLAGRRKKRAYIQVTLNADRASP